MTKWTERDFEFEGKSCTYYILPNEQPPIFIAPKNGSMCDYVWIPLFDLRITNDGIRKNIHLAIKSYCELNPDIDEKSIHCHIVRYESCKNHVGIMCHSFKCSVKENFAPKATDEIDMRRRRLLKQQDCEDQWGIIHKTKKPTDEDWKNLTDFELQLEHNNNLIDEMLTFENSIDIKHPSWV